LDPRGIVYLDLTGTYDRTTGALAVSGGTAGPVTWNFARNAVGTFPVPNDWHIWIQLSNISLSLNGVVALDENNLPFINGTDLVPPPGGPGNLTVGSG